MAVKFERVEIEPPVWSFNRSDDSERWIAEFGLSTFVVVDDGLLSTESTADDPAMALLGATIPASFNQMTIRLRVSEGRGELGQLFFGTESSPALSESQSITFDVNGDGDFHDDVIDLTRKPSWDGTITSLRLDPVELAGRRIDIDSITSQRADSSTRFRAVRGEGERSVHLSPGESMMRADCVTETTTMSSG